MSGRAARRTLALALLGTAACHRPRALAPSPAPPTIEVSGCAAIVRAPAADEVRCELPPDRTLRLVLAGSTTQGWIPLVDGARIEGVERLALGDPAGSERLRLTVPSGATSVRLAFAGTGAVARWSLVAVAPPASSALDRARADRAAGRVAEAEKTLVAAATTTTGEERGRVLSLSARLALGAGRIDDAIARFREAIAAHRASGRRSDEVDDTFALTVVLVQHARRFAEARAVLAAIGERAGADRGDHGEPVTDALADYPDGRARRPYYAAAIALETGDLVGALRSLREAKARAERLGLARLAQMVDQQLAIALQRSGRNREALALLDAIRARDGATMSACDRADLLTNLGWVALLAREARADAASPVRDPRAPLEEALTLLRGPCDAPRDRANVLVDLALAAALASDVATARARLVEARAELAMTKDGGGGAAIAPWIAEIDARIALGAGDAKGALEAYRRARGLAEATFAVDVAWRAAIGEGEAQEALSQPELALEAYLRAEAQLDEASADVAILEGRDAFLGDRERSARALVDLLVRLGRGDEALLAARRARGRAMAALARADRLAGLSPAERSRWDEALGDYRLGRDALDAESSGDWQLPADRLAAVRATRGAREERLRQRLDDAFTLIARARPDARRAPTSAGEALPVGTVLLTHHPLRRGWVAFAADAQGVASQILPSLPRADATPREQSDALLAPFQAKLATATRVRVLPYGPLHAVDFHALPFGEGALLDRAAVEYALDQASATDADTKADLARGAVLIVADPQGNLPSARREANAVERALAGRAGRAGGSVSTLLGAQATSPAVRRALEGASWLHYAGHADFAVDDPWRSELPLAEGGRLSIGDVLALPRAPAIVALFACESGRTDARAEGIGLAQAFLVAGSRAVFAATRPVADELAAELASEMYGNVGAAAPTEPANLLRRAQLAVRGRGDRRDWGAFRVLLP